MAQSVAFDVRDNLRETLVKFTEATQKHIEAAVPRALNRTLTTVRADSARKLQKFYPGMKSSTVKRQIKVRRATKSSQTAQVTYSGRRFRLFGNFRVATRQYPTGTGLAKGARLPPHVMTSAGQELSAADLQRVFLQRSRQHRKPNFWLRVGRERMPIEVLVVRGVAVTFVEENIAAALNPVARDRFIKVLTQELKFRTGDNG